MTDTSKYFAALTGDELAQELLARVEQFEELREPAIRRWKRNLALYHNKSCDAEGNEITDAGEQAEYASIRVNHFRNIVQHLLNLTVGTRPTFQARATNSDQKSLQQARLANNLLDYYMREKHLDLVLKKAAEYSIVMDEGFVCTVWNPDGGRELMVEHIDEVPGTDPSLTDGDFPGEPTTRERIVYEGDLAYEALSPLDVIVDPSKACFEDNTWVIVRRYRSRWDLAATFPEKAEEVLAQKAPMEAHKDIVWNKGYDLVRDDVMAFEFFHKRTAALPNGKYALFTQDGVTLMEMPLQYRDLPVSKVTAGSELGSQFGYSMANDVAPLQDVVNLEMSTILTNHEAFGVQTVCVPRDSGVGVSHLEGMTVIEYDSSPTGGKPEPLNLTQTPNEIFRFLELCIAQMETISGVNSVVRGNPQASLESGTAIALVQQQALEYASHLSASYVACLEDVGTKTVRLLRDFATTPRLVHIAGKHKIAAMREFNGDDLENVNRVVVDLGNPLSRTTAGRVELAYNLINFGLIKSPEEYLTVIETGSLEPLTEGLSGELGLIRHENELLMEGQDSPVLVVDDHRLHVLEHKSILSNPEIRMGSPIVQTVLAHIQQHIQYLNDPMAQQLHALLGQTTGQPQMAPGQMPPQPAPMQDVQGGGVPVQGPQPPQMPAGAGPMNTPAPPAPQIPQ